MFVIFTLLPLVLILVSLADIILRDSSQIKHLPKTFWIVLVIILPLVGSILWFTIGREYPQRRVEPVSLGDPRRWDPALTEPIRSMTTEEEIAAIDAEITHHENQARIRRLQADLEAKRRDVQ